MKLATKAERANRSSVDQILRNLRNKSSSASSPSFLFELDHFLTKTSDIVIVCFLHENNDSLQFLLGSSNATSTSAASLVALMTKMNARVLERFEVASLVPFLVRFCGGGGGEALQQQRHALTVLQSLHKEPLLDIFIELGFVPRLMAVAVGGGGTSTEQHLALQIVQTACGFKTPDDLTERVCVELDKIHFLPALAGPIFQCFPDEVLSILLNVCTSKINNAALASRCFDAVVLVLQQHTAHGNSSHDNTTKYDALPCLLRQAYGKTSLPKRRRVFDELVRGQCFPSVFATAYMVGADDMLAMVQEFAMMLMFQGGGGGGETGMAPQELAALSSFAAALHKHLVEAHREELLQQQQQLKKHSRSPPSPSPSPPFWGVLCLLTLHHVGATTSFGSSSRLCLSQYGATSASQLSTAMALLRPLLRSRAGGSKDVPISGSSSSDEVEDGEGDEELGALPELLLGVLFALDYDDHHGDKKDGRLRRLLGRTMDLAKRIDDATVQQLVLRCQAKMGGGEQQRHRPRHGSTTRSAHEWSNHQ